MTIQTGALADGTVLYDHVLRLIAKAQIMPYPILIEVAEALERQANAEDDHADDLLYTIAKYLRLEAKEAQNANT